MRGARDRSADAGRDRVGETPGRTHSINLFALGIQGITDAILADLPGYGYAAVPKQDKIRWQQGRSVILMHDTKVQTARAVPLVLEWIVAENERTAEGGPAGHEAERITRSGAAFQKLDGV